MVSNGEEEPESLVELRRELFSLQARASTEEEEVGGDGSDGDDGSEIGGRQELSELDLLAQKLTELRRAGGQTDRNALWEQIEAQLKDEPGTDY